MSKLQNQINALRDDNAQLRRDITEILNVMVNRRFFRLNDDLNYQPILNTIPNPICRYADLSTGECGCVSSKHKNDPCPYPAWFADCVSFRGPHDELPEIYKHYNKTPRDMERTEVTPTE